MNNPNTETHTDYSTIAQDDLITCFKCGEEIQYCDSHNVAGVDGDYCEECVEYCDFCDSYVLEYTHGGNTVNGDVALCTHCLHEHFFDCSRCEDVWQRGTGHTLTDENGVPYEVCPACYDEAKDKEHLYPPLIQYK